MHVPARENLIVNRLNKTKIEREVDHEADRQDRLRAEGRVKKAQAQEVVSLPPFAHRGTVADTVWGGQEKQAQAQRKIWEESKKSRRFEGLFSEEAFDERKRTEEEDGDDFM